MSDTTQADRGSYLQSIRQKRDKRVKDLHLDLTIPTWSGDLVARFKVLDRSVMEKFGNRERNVEVDTDFIIKAIDSLWVRDPERMVSSTRMQEDEDYARVENDMGVAVTFTQELGEWLGIGQSPDDEHDLNKMRARDLVLYLFDDNSIAIGGFVVRLIAWMTDTDQKVGSAISGE